MHQVDLFILGRKSPYKYRFGGNTVLGLSQASSDAGSQGPREGTGSRERLLQEGDSTRFERGRREHLLQH